MEVTTNVKKKDFNVWMELFKAHNGRFLFNPVDFYSEMYVRYTFDNPDDYMAFNDEYRRLRTPIIETRRGFWKRLKSKFGL